MIDGNVSELADAGGDGEESFLFSPRAVLTLESSWLAKRLASSKGALCVCPVTDGP